MPPGERPLPTGYICKICKEPGHHIRDCPQAGQNQPAGAQRKSGPPDTYVCRVCSEPGHWIQDCPVKAQQDLEREARRQESGNRGGK